MLDSFDEIAAALEREGVKPYVDPVFRFPHVYAKFLSSLHERGLITWGAELVIYLWLVFCCQEERSSPYDTW